METAPTDFQGIRYSDWTGNTYGSSRKTQGHNGKEYWNPTVSMLLLYNGLEKAEDGWMDGSPSTQPFKNAEYTTVCLCFNSVQTCAVFW